MVRAKGHPARFPQKLPEFFIQFLTDPRDTVLDIFAGSNTTGAVAERLGRRWIAFELEQEYLATSAFRFLSEVDEGLVEPLYDRLCVEGATNIAIPQVLQERLLDEREEYVTESELEVD